MENRGREGSEAAGILEAGTRLGKYEIRRLIGLGSMSAVYEGARRDTGRRVAIKVLSPKLAGVPEARGRFLTEARLTARLRHAHIVDVVEVGEDGERAYLVMAMLEGEDLGRLLQHSSFLSAAETADILVPVCEAVATAHEGGVVHRDLKPANIFLAIRDQKTHPVVLDFGIANDTAEGAGAVPDSRLVFGTPFYLSPEQIADHRAASPASDQWALGVVLYQCLTGARPYDGESLDDLYGAIGAGNALLPSERRPGIPPELEQVVMRAMSSDPKARFASVTELAQALRPFRSGVGEAKAPSRRRAPSSPAIVVEASTQSPFARTLTPEVDVLDGLWFEPDPSEETAGDATLSQGRLAGEGESGADAQRPMSSEAWLTFVGGRTERSRSFSDRGFSVRRFLGRFPARRIGAAAGGALGGLALLLLFARGGSSQRGGTQGTVTVRAEAIVQSPGTSAMPSVGQAIAAPAVAKERPITQASAAARSLSVAAVKEPVVVKEPMMVKEPVVVKEPTAVREPVVVKEPTAVKEPTVMEPAARLPVTPAANRSFTAERRVRAQPTPLEAQTATGPSAHDAAERPRVRTSPEVRMHKGVPLLD